MPIVYPDILDLAAQSYLNWSARDTSLYALGAGLGRDPMSPEELAYLIGRAPKTLSTFAASLAVGRGVSAKDMGVSFRNVVHLGQEVEIARPLAGEGEAVVSTRLVDAFDRGEGRGAILVSETLFSEVSGGGEIARCRSTLMARADGGFGGPPPPPRNWTPPRESPDLTISFETRPEQALLFRLSGDTNPLHVDPAIAAAAGFERPILHGLCTFALAGRAVASLADTAASVPIRQIGADFSAPVYPGETIAVDLWRDGEDVLFSARVEERNLVVLKYGRSKISTPTAPALSIP